MLTCGTCVYLTNPEESPIGITLISLGFPEDRPFCIKKAEKALFRIGEINSSPYRGEVGSGHRMEIIMSCAASPSDKACKFHKARESTRGCFDCYIATTVYGDYDSPQVITLRKFRDEFLSHSYLGKLFIKTYYVLGSPLANWIGRTKHIKRIVKKALDGFVGYLNKTANKCDK